jgi:hypothetical protein
MQSYNKAIFLRRQEDRPTPTSRLMKTRSKSGERFTAVPLPCIVLGKVDGDRKVEKEAGRNNWSQWGCLSSRYRRAQSSSPSNPGGSVAVYTLSRPFLNVYKKFARRFGSPGNRQGEALFPKFSIGKICLCAAPLVSS